MKRRSSERLRDTFSRNDESALVQIVTIFGVTISPEADCFISRDGGKILRDFIQRTGTKVESSDGLGVLGEDSDGGSGQVAPHSDDLVCGSGRYHPDILAHRHVRDLGARASEGEDKSA